MKKVKPKNPNAKIGRPKKVENTILESAEVKQVGKLGKPKPRAKKVKRIPPLVSPAV